ncbi:MAG TPA: TorF family putative porin [Caulobacteraceae bacterium]|nr:TorF family putative porin [Caulobacteraceae bacterium]
MCGALYLAVSGLSDYRYDGSSQSDRSPTWQGNLHCWRADGWYAGAVLTAVDFGDQPPTTMEADLYGGRHVAVGANDLNLELLWTHFDKSAPGPSYDVFEPQAELTRAFGRLTVKGLVAWSPEGSDHTGRYWHLKGTVAYAVAPWLSFSGRLGRIWSERGQDRWHFDAGATASWKRLSLDARYGGTDLGPAQCYGTMWCAPGAYASVTWRLLP